MIVNTTEEHAWYNGHISNAILTNAGPKMHQALESTSAIRNIIVTGPYKLHCAKVYHTLCKNRSAYKACEVGCGFVFKVEVNSSLKITDPRKYFCFRFPSMCFNS